MQQLGQAASMMMYNILIEVMIYSMNAKLRGRGQELGRRWQEGSRRFQTLHVVPVKSLRPGTWCGRVYG